jgi:hypothetical protein
MFTGFASENTPAVQVWDISRGASTSAQRIVSLPDDCAPIQFFKTGLSAAGTIRLYLPSSYPEGKLLTIINSPFSSSAQVIDVFSSEARGNTFGQSGTQATIYQVRPGAVLQLFYTKLLLEPTGASFTSSTGWVCISQGYANSSTFGSLALGGGSVTSGNAFAFGSGASASGGGSFAAAGQNAQATGGASIAMGDGNTASGTNAAVVGGNSNTASSTNAAVVGGTTNQATNGAAAVLGGNNNIANSDRSVVVGGAVGTTRSIVGNFVAPASYFPIAGQSGVQQSATLILGRQTTDATATRLASDQFTAGTTNQVILPNNSAYTFQGTCIAARTAAGDTSSWKFEGVIKRGANAASTALVAAVTPTVIAQDAGASTWVLAITADTTNGGIAVTVTGAAATTIRWVCKIETTEVTF